MQTYQQRPLARIVRTHDWHILVSSWVIYKEFVMMQVSAGECPYWRPTSVVAACLPKHDSSVSGGSAASTALPTNITPPLHLHSAYRDLRSNPVSGQIPLSWQQPGVFPHLSHLLLSRTLLDEVPFGILGRPGVLPSLMAFDISGCNIRARLPDLLNATDPTWKELVM